MSTKFWYSTIGHLATRRLSPFSGVACVCAYAHMIFTAVSKRDTLSKDAIFLLNESHLLYLLETYDFTDSIYLFVLTCRN